MWPEDISGLLPTVRQPSSLTLSHLGVFPKANVPWAGVFRALVEHLKKYISGLNDLAYADALTSVRNRGAFDIYVRNMETELKEAGGQKEFAICMIDCNGLKAINDQAGHDKGDFYLKAACSLVCHVFVHSPVFRIGGDEFAVILQKSDYEHRKELLLRFDEACAESRSRGLEIWEQVDVARGVAVYDPKADGTVTDVVRRADKLMYENKWLTKNRRAKKR